MTLDTPSDAPDRSGATALSSRQAGVDYALIDPLKIAKCVGSPEK